MHSDLFMAVSLSGKCFFFCLPLWFVNSYQLGLSGL